MTQINTSLADKLTQVVVNKAVENGDLPAMPTTKGSARAPRTIRVAKEKTEGTNKKETKTVKKPSNSEVKPKGHNTSTIGGLANTLLENGYGAEETLAAVLRVFPAAQTTMKCIYYYASKNPRVSLSNKKVADPKALKQVLAGLR
jgi:hypothetical protein